MPLPYTFGNVTTAFGSWLDADFASMAEIITIPGITGGTANAIILTPFSNSPTVQAYVLGQSYSCLLTNTNTGDTTLNVSSLGALHIYKDTAAGPVRLTGGELVATTFACFVYDNTLNSGAGGFHIFNPNIPLPTGAAYSITGASGTTLTAAQLTGGAVSPPPFGATLQSIIVRSGPVAGYTDTTDTAANIVASIPDCIVGLLFRFKFINQVNQTMTLGLGTGVTSIGPAGATITQAGLTSHEYLALVTNITGGTQAVTIFG